MRVTRKGLTAALAATLFGTAMLDMAPAADVVKIRLSYTVPISNSASILLEKRDLARTSANPISWRSRVLPARRS